MHPVRTNLPCRRIQIEEIWSFVHGKEKNLSGHLQGRWGMGDVWTFTALCADTKLVPCWQVGRRDGAAGKQFLLNLAARIRGRFELAGDGLLADREAVQEALAGEAALAPLQHLSRFNRFSKTFSRKLGNLTHALSLHFMNYNFAQIHADLQMTPAMAAGVSDHVWGLEEIAGLPDAQ